MSTATPRTGREASVPEVPRTDHVDAVRLTDLHKTFGDVTAVDGVDLTIRPGEVVALLGPNGAGKTTTIDMILGLSPHSPGGGSRRIMPRGLGSPSSSSPTPNSGFLPASCDTSPPGDP